jgi:GTP cyclohydrolase I
MNDKQKDQKQKRIAKHFAGIMEELGLDLQDDSLKDTPNRVAKMYVHEIFSGLHSAPPKITTFKNKENYDQMLVMKDVTIYSCCEHHFVPIHGKAHIAYIPKDEVIGLSKLIRVAQYFAAKPQLQERLTQEIGNFLQECLGTQDVAVVIEAAHFCCSMRGARDPNSQTITSFLGGSFKALDVRSEFFNHLKC